MPLLELEERHEVVDHIALDPREGVLMVYLPGCPFCDKIMPYYEAFARASTRKVAMAQPHAVEGIVPVVVGYPTFLASKNGKVTGLFHGASRKSVNRLKKIMQPKHSGRIRGGAFD